MEELLASLLTSMVRYPTLLPLLVTLGVASYYDTKYREIPMSILAVCTPGVLVALAFRLFIAGPATLRFPDIAVVVTVGAAAMITTYALSRKGYLGSGDVPVVTLLAIGTPYTVEVLGFRAPVLVMIILLGTTYIVAELLSNILHNISSYAVFKEATDDVGVAEKVYYFLVGRAMTVDEFRNTKFYFPVKYSGLRRLTAKVGVEPLDASEYEVVGKVLIAVKGIPFVVLLFVGLALTVVLIVLSGPYC